MIQFCEARLKESNEVLNVTSEMINDKNASEKDRNDFIASNNGLNEIKQMLENKIQEQKEQIRLGKTSSIDDMSSSELLEEVKKLLERFGPFTHFHIA